jgi:hypothetical protein
MTWSWFRVGLLGCPHCQKNTAKKITLMQQTRMKKVVMEPLARVNTRALVLHFIGPPGP